MKVRFAELLNRSLNGYIVDLPVSTKPPKLSKQVVERSSPISGVLELVLDSAFSLGRDIKPSKGPV